MLEQGGRKRAVAAIAVKGHVVRLGGERSERPNRVLNGREALRLAGPRTRLERVVTAGIEKDEIDRRPGSCPARATACRRKPAPRKLTHGQYDMRHAVDPDRGLSCGHGHPSPRQTNSHP